MFAIKNRYKINYMKKILFGLLYIFTANAIEQDKIPHLVEGNLALPASQQPTPLFCFGQNIVNKGDTQVIISTDCLTGKNRNFAEIVPTLLYGITDNLSLFTGIPIAMQFKLDNHRSSSCEDIFAQLEYAFYNKETLHSLNQATLVGNITIPTGSFRKTPPTGYGLPSFFLGATASYTGCDWYFFGSSGALLTIPHHHIKFSNQFLYQAGIGRNLNYVTSKRLITLTIELFGNYNLKNNSRRQANLNVGGIDSNSFFIGPSLWVATQQFVLEIGIAFPAIQQVRSRAKNTCLFALELRYKI